MISYDEALTQILDSVTPLPTERVAIEDAFGRVLADHVKAAIDSPRNDVSAMDGYAVRHAEAREGGWLTIVGEAAAGIPFAGELGTRQAVRIFTGAHVPQGADCVVIQEEAERDGDRVRFRQSFGPARHIRSKGSDFYSGSTVLEAGTQLSPASIVALAGADCADVAVSRRPLVSIIATGEELVDPGRAARTRHSIPESGSFGVTAMAIRNGASVVGKFHGPDHLAALEVLAEKALAPSDLVIVLGGASAGDYDFAKPMFERLGLTLHFSKVAIKPGKPVWFGSVGEKYVLGLPGNPGSAMVTARVFLDPLLVVLQGGQGEACVTSSKQVLGADLGPCGTRETFVRARMLEGALYPVANQESGAQAPLATSNWLIRRSAGDYPIAAGDLVRAIPF